MAEQVKRCARPGCGKEYKESENSDTACRYHNGKVIFHDTQKGWTCCNKVVYDFDEFQKIEGCCAGMQCPANMCAASPPHRCFRKVGLLQVRHSRPRCQRHLLECDDL